MLVNTRKPFRQEPAVPRVVPMGKRFQQKGASVLRVENLGAMKCISGKKQKARPPLCSERGTDCISAIRERKNGTSEKIQIRAKGRENPKQKNREWPQTGPPGPRCGHSLVAPQYPSWSMASATFLKPAILAPFT